MHSRLDHTFRVWMLVLVTGALATSAGAVTEVSVVEFDVLGTGVATPALRITGVEREPRPPFILTQALDLLANESYCVTFDLAVRNAGNDRPGRFNFDLQLDSTEANYLTPVVPRDSTFRDRVFMVVRSEAGGPSELVIRIEHDIGLVPDPSLYIDNIQIRPLSNEILVEHVDPQTIFVSPTTVLGATHDLSLQGITPDHVVGSAIVEFIVWDDPEPRERTPEIVEIVINDVVLWRQDIAGTEEFPWVIKLRLPWLECKSGYDGFLEWRLRTIPGLGWPAGALYFGGANVRFEVGEWGRSLLRNGGFDQRFEAWLCNGAACGQVVVESRSWSGVKRLFR